MVRTCLRPRNWPRRCSKASLKRPVVSQPSSEASTSSSISRAPITLPEGGTAVRPGTKAGRREREVRVIARLLRAQDPVDSRERRRLQNPGGRGAARIMPAQAVETQPARRPAVAEIARIKHEPQIPIRARHRDDGASAQTFRIRGAERDHRPVPARDSAAIRLPAGRVGDMHGVHLDAHNQNRCLRTMSESPDSHTMYRLGAPGNSRRPAETG